MRSLVGSIVDLVKPPEVKTPVPFASNRITTGLSMGQPDNRETQLDAMGSVGTVFAIVDRLANAVSQVEWTLYNKAPSGLDEDRTPVQSHACIDLWNKPNPFMHRQEFVEVVQQHIELTGEGYPLVAKMPGLGLPLELWPARPDRMRPVPHPTKYMTGWFYVFEGEKVPLELDEVIQLRRPNPKDPYRGISPVQPINADLDSTRYAAEWNRNFFVNGAEPGGLIMVEEELSDDRWRELQMRWNEQHRGVSRAHRVAILEGGATWQDRTVTQKDMQFVQLRQASRDTIMEAWAFGKPMLGITDDVNRANAEAGEVVFARWQLISRLERWKAALNCYLLPMYGTAEHMEWDYENPVPEDREAENAALTARTNAAKTLTEAGWHPEDVLEVTGLPPMRFEKPEPPPPPIPPAPPAVEPAEPDEEEADDEEEEAPTARRPAGRPRAVVEGPDDIDVTPVQEAWQRQLDTLLAAWGTITAAQRAQLIEQIIAAIDNNDMAGLTALRVDSAEAAALLEQHMTELGATAGERVVTEAVQQGVDGVEPKPAPASAVADLAAVTAGMLAAGMALSAGREAMRVQSPGMTGRQVADAVEVFLASQSDAAARTELGGALTGAQNSARVETFRAAPVAALYANEKLDNNTCQNCRAIDGRFIGLTSDGVTMDEVDRLYPMGGYVDCLGRARCRGTITGVWPQQTTQEGGE